jgi:hypothetical protein
MNHIGLAIGIGVFVTGACELADIGTEVKDLGPYQTARPFDCRMQMIFGPLPYPHQDIARARTECPDHQADEELCFDDIRRRACLVGADTVYGVAETREGAVSYLTATFARSLPGPIAEAASRGPAKLACDPMCSPGFACRSGTCVPECNPACAVDEICTRQRVCAPTTATKVLTKPRIEERRQIATVISWDHTETRHQAGNDVAVDLAGEAASRAAAAPGEEGVRRIDVDPVQPERSSVMPPRRR